MKRLCGKDDESSFAYYGNLMKFNWIFIENQFLFFTEIEKIHKLKMSIEIFNFEQISSFFLTYFIMKSGLLDTVV